MAIFSEVAEHETRVHYYLLGHILWITVSSQPICIAIMTTWAFVYFIYLSVTNKIYHYGQLMEPRNSADETCLKKA